MVSYKTIYEIYMVTLTGRKALLTEYDIEYELSDTE